MPDICKAINDLRMLSFYYDGYPRVVEPHTYGQDSKGHYLLRGWQTRGLSKSGQLNWKLFRCDEMQNLRILEETFVGWRPGYTRGDKAFETIQCEL